MRNNEFALFFIACVWASKAAADPSLLRGRMLLPCSQYDISECRDHEDRCEVIQVSGEKNYCADLKNYDRCSEFNNNDACWGHTKCVWVGNQDRCEDISSATRSSDFCEKNNDCKVDEICVPLSFSSDPCLDTLGQCILRPNTCPSTDEPVCGCDGRTYSNQCKCLKAGEKVKYGASCSPERDRDFRRYVRDLDDPYEYTNDYIKQYMYSSVSTNGDTCLTVQECKKQSLDIDHRNSFRVISDPNNCGCFEWKGATYWSDHNKCSGQKKRAVSLQNTRVRVRCDLNRIYQDVRNVPIDTCLQASECDAQCYHDIRSHTKMKTDRSSNICGCYRRGNQCYYNSCGNNQKKADKNLPGSYTRVWCEDRVRDVRDLVYDTCLTQDECNEQGEINGDVKTPAMVKDFGNDHICGCHEKGGQLYWARCDVRGNFYRELNNKNTRVHCVDVETRRRSYRVFDQEHSHPHTHPHGPDDHYDDYDRRYYDYDNYYYYPPI